MDFDLPIISGEASPEFADARSCAQWLEALPLINVGPSHGRLLGQLEELNCFAMPAAERVKVLELLREPVLFVQNEHAKKFSARAVPLSRQEREIFENVLALWDAFAYGWEHCVQAFSAAPGAEAALACQRALWSVGQKIAEHFKAYQSVAPRDWKRLHRLYRFAESNRILREKVNDPAGENAAETCCADTYVHALLSDVASPNQQTPRQQLMVSRWLRRWANKVEIVRQPDAQGGPAPLSVDLESEGGASRTAKESTGVRYVHVEELEKSIQKRIARLRAGESPEVLGLGDDVQPPLASQLLAMLHRQWCEDPTARESARRLTVRNAELCSGLAALHYYATGQPFRQPGVAKELSQRQREEIATFGRMSSRDEDQYAAVQIASLEHWEICDESLSGFRLRRPPDGGEGRFTHRQLVAVRPSDAKIFIACTVHWLAVSAEGSLTMGTRVIPGVPCAAAVRPTGVNALTEKYVPALCLPAIPALKVPATVLIPAGWYRPKRVIELYAEKSQSVILSAALERGSNYDRCTFEPAQ